MKQEVSSVAQPIICCIGTSVAGRPTQFLIERTVVNLGLDWRAISVEVTPENFPAACTGILAMRFQGLRMFGEFEKQSVSVLAGSDPAAKFIGSITSGKISAQGLRLWDQIGHAWIEILKSKFSDMAAFFWLHGDSRETRSLFSAMVILGKDAPPWFWTQAPLLAIQESWPQEWNRWKSEGRIAEQIDSAAIHELLTKWFVDIEKKKTPSKKEVGAKVSPSDVRLKAPPGDDTPKDVSVPPVARIGWISDIQVMPSDVSSMLVSLPVELILHEHTKFSDLGPPLPIHRISSSEVAAAGEAYDFRQWTGQSVDLGFLQDAYDEYCDF